MPFDFRLLTIENIRQGAYQTELPELYQLRGLIENNASHDHDDVFEHNLRTATALETLLNQSNQQIQASLGESVGCFTGGQILWLAGLFHDIGKARTEVRDGEYNRFPGHESSGAEILKSMLTRFGLATAVAERLIYLVGEHGVLHQEYGAGPESFQKKWLEIYTHYPAIILELVLLTIADTAGANTPKNNQPAQEIKIEFFKHLLQKIVVG